MHVGEAPDSNVGADDEGEEAPRFVMGSVSWHYLQAFVERAPKSQVVTRYLSSRDCFLRPPWLKRLNDFAAYAVDAGTVGHAPSSGDWCGPRMLPADEFLDPAQAIRCPG
jgi:hypothetical protein